MNISDFNEWMNFTEITLTEEMCTSDMITLWFCLNINMGNTDFWDIILETLPKNNLLLAQ